ncbi:MAG: hypothetical protein M3P84_04490, partial [Chloroflexota bacterium]|nr:hypothetical protein [Chloroflexota bacterium]
MNERPTEPYNPADAASTPAAPALTPAAPTPVTPARISTTGGPTAEPAGAGAAGALPHADLEPAGYTPQPDRVDRDRIAWERPAQA